MTTVVTFSPPAVISVVWPGACLGFTFSSHRTRTSWAIRVDADRPDAGRPTSTTAPGRSQNACGARDVFALLSPFLLVVAVMFVPMLDLL